LPQSPYTSFPRREGGGHTSYFYVLIELYPGLLWTKAQAILEGAQSSRPSPYLVGPASVDSVKPKKGYSKRARADESNGANSLDGFYTAKPNNKSFEKLVISYIGSHGWPIIPSSESPVSLY